MILSRTLPDGRVAQVYPLLFGGARLGVGPAGRQDFEDAADAYDDVW